MCALIAKLIERLGLAGDRGTPSPDPTDGPYVEVHAEPRIGPDSTLDMMAKLDPAAATTYAEAVLDDIGRCIEACSLADPSTSEPQALEQIHSLKNAIAPTGSAELLKACEQIRLDTCRGADRAALEQRHNAVANAAAMLVKSYRRSLTTLTNSAEKHG